MKGSTGKGLEILKDRRGQERKHGRIATMGYRQGGKKTGGGSKEEAFQKGVKSRGAGSGAGRGLSNGKNSSSPQITLERKSGRKFPLRVET